MRYPWFFTIACLGLVIFTSGVYAHEGHNHVEGLAQAASNEEESDETPVEEPSPTPVDIPNQPFNLTVSPISEVIRAKPGESITRTVKIRNNSNQTEYLTPSLVTFEADENGGPLLRDFKDSETFKNWLTFSETDLTVRSNEWQTLEVTFNPPEDAALGYFYAVIFKRQQEATPEPGATNLTGAPAILVLANVETPNAIREAQLVDFAVPKMVFEFLPVEFSVNVKNSGNVFLAPGGDLFLSGPRSKDLAVLTINPGNGNILPDSTREFLVTWDDGFPRYIDAEEDGKAIKDAEGNPVKRLEWDFSRANRLRFGKYTAHMIMVYDNGERDVPIESKVSFWGDSISFDSLGNRTARCSSNPGVLADVMADEVVSEEKWLEGQVVYIDSG